ncbi:MAG: hypothetical protein KJO79_02435 [Verrucomicrobiae bacterium]|nr:hypothetical protein [Verrucomicrobiae bacterium]NNJ86012.1 hypothetical protein [Akkermansiaceae bacterium]
MSPNYALVASQLDPEAFGRHYATGSSRFYNGTVIFAEIENTYRHDYFKIDEMLKEVKPSPDGTPKRTKFIATYRVIEHIDLSAFKDLYVVSVEGEVLGLQQAPYERQHGPGFVRTFQEICPFGAVVLSHMTPPEFGEYITDPNQPKGAPKVVFTQIDLNINEFLSQIEANPFHHSPLPNVHPQKLRDQILEIKGNPEKRTKGVSLDSAIDRLSFLRLRGGFWISSGGPGGEMIFYPVPDHDTLEKDHYAFYKSVSG